MIQNMDEVIHAEPQWPKVILMTVGQLLSMAVMCFVIPLFSLAYFGEGAHGEHFGNWVQTATLGIPPLFITMANVIVFRSARFIENYREAKSIMLVQTFVTLSYLVFLVWMLLQK